MLIQGWKELQRRKMEDARDEAVEARGRALRYIAAVELGIDCEKIDFLTLDTQWAAGQVKITSAVLVFGERVMSDIVVDSVKLEVISSRPWVVE